MPSGRRARALMLASPRRLRAEWRLRRDIAALRGSELFDAAWYLATYPDVAAAGIDPARHYLKAGAQEGRNPSARFSGRDYLDRNPDVARAGSNPLMHYLRHGAREGRAGATRDAPVVVGDLAPLYGFPAPRGAAPRVTLLTDSLRAGSLFGGVGTALLFATALAGRLGATLRVVTETQPPDRDAAAVVLRTHGIAPPADIEFVFAERRRPDRREIDLRRDDLFVTTGWWHVWNLLHAASARQVIHLLQDDERLFYPHGDAHLLCSEVLATPGLRFAVNTRLLHAHFAAEGFGDVAARGAWFEPAFPHECYHWEDRAEDGRMTFLFYARPGHPRNLYARGLAAVRAAIERRILDPGDWDFVFVGHDLADVTLPRGVVPRMLQNLRWPEYAAQVRRADLGLALMYSPHPGYPALDLAASGAVAVTNSCGRKRSLAAYSANILCVDANLDSLIDGIARGARLARDLPARRRNYVQNGLGRDWTTAFAPAIERLLAQPSPGAARHPLPQAGEGRKAALLLPLPHAGEGRGEGP